MKKAQRIGKDIGNADEGKHYAQTAENQLIALNHQIICDFILNPVLAYHVVVRADKPAHLLLQGSHLGGIRSVFG